MSGGAGGGEKRGHKDSENKDETSPKFQRRNSKLLFRKRSWEAWDLREKLKQYTANQEHQPVLLAFSQRAEKGLLEDSWLSQGT